jgi:hypothetical protein
MSTGIKLKTMLTSECGSAHFWTIKNIRPALTNMWFEMNNKFYISRHLNSRICSSKKIFCRVIPRRVVAGGEVGGKWCGCFFWPQTFELWLHLCPSLSQWQVMQWRGKRLQIPASDGLMWGHKSVWQPPATYRQWTQRRCIWNFIR